MLLALSCYCDCDYLLVIFAFYTYVFFLCAISPTYLLTPILSGLLYLDSSRVICKEYIVRDDMVSIVDGVVTIR